MKKHIILKVTRWIILLIILILVTVMGRLHQMIKLYPSIDAFCPFGGLESAWAFLRYQGFLKRIGWSSFILLFASVGTALVFRRSFCGNICPLGFLQEIFGKIGGKIFRFRLSLPPGLDRVFRYLKYGVLVLFLGLSWKTLSLAIRPYDPWLAYHHLGAEELLSSYLIGTIILGLSLLVGMFIDRPFCRYLCPMGAFLVLPSRLGITRIKRNVSTCIDCSLCTKACPMGIDVAETVTVKSAECISCSECVNICPVENTLEYRIPGGKRIPASVVLWGTFGLFAAVIAFTTVNKTFVWKADSGLEKSAERLLWGPQRINDTTSLWDVVQVFQIHPAYFAGELGLEREEQFYLPLSELGIEPSRVEEMVNTLYQDAGLDPRNLFGEGKGGGGSCSGDH